MSNNLYPITYWYGIRKEFLSRERLKEAREAGFNLIECAYDTETNLRVLALCAELGLRANVQDPRMSIALLGEPGWEAELDAMIADYRDCPALNRFFVRDEPTDDYFPTLGRVVDYLHAHDPVHGEYINLGSRRSPSCPLNAIRRTSTGSCVPSTRNCFPTTTTI